MRTELHNLCNLTSEELHYLLNDDALTNGYILQMSTKEEAGRRIKAARLAKTMRLEDVCSKAPGITVSRLSNWEQGRNMIGVDEAKKLAPVLGVTASYLLTTDDSPNDERERAILDIFRISDERGKANIYRAAESESVYTTGREEPHKKDKSNQK